MVLDQLDTKKLINWIFPANLVNCLQPFNSIFHIHHTIWKYHQVIDVDMNKGSNHICFLTKDAWCMLCFFKFWAGKVSKKILFQYKWACFNSYNAFSTSICKGETQKHFLVNSPIWLPPAFYYRMPSLCRAEHGINLDWKNGARIF